MSDKGEVDYGYGDAAPDYDYGYGDGSPDGAGKDGDAVDFGYGDSTDYGYGDDQAQQKSPTEEEKEPRRAPRARRNSCVIRKDTNNLAVAEFLMGPAPTDATPAASS